ERRVGCEPLEPVVHRTRVRGRALVPVEAVHCSERVHATTMSHRGPRRMAFVDAAARTLRIVITRVRRYRRGAAEVEEIPLDSIHGWSGSKDQLLWVDIVGDADRETEALA